MLNTLLDPVTQQPRHPGFWWATGGLAAALLGIFWGVCSHQMEAAQNRVEESRMAQTALADCLQYIPGATVGSCTERIMPGTGTRTAAAPVEGPTPVSFNTR